jgi:hypothetical protein
VPDALSGVGRCTPGPQTSDLKIPLKSGNLQAVARDDGSIVFSLAASGKVLFSALPGFAVQNDTSTPPAGMCTVGAVVSNSIGTPENITVDAAFERCSNLDGCKGFSVKGGECFGGGVATIHFKSATPPEAGVETDGNPAWRTWTKAGMPPGYLVSTLILTAGDKDERVYGLGQGNWTQEGGCPAGPQRIVPLERNGQTVGLHQRKFHVSIPFVYSTAGERARRLPVSYTHVYTVYMQPYHNIMTSLTGKCWW